ncbi:MAG: nucleotidyl transferase AbiEii/AbiGii toxin family protein, partial [Polyangiaceae bacterium]|nr:nucleotidyl transferase AbiEii/AbiGii toxin family protein [Polyangiaceae bacterium]
WKLEIADDDPDQQTIVFQYPAGLAQASAAVPAYVRPVVRMELGARSEHWPATVGEVTPYAAEDFPNLFLASTSSVHVLAAERTYWEKATILHMWYHAPADKSLRDRQSRHYYDLVRMYQHGIGRDAMKNTDLLLKVAEHKSVFFASAAAKYSEAKPGTLRLVPPESRFAELRRDYQSMQEMIFGEMPSFDELMKTLGKIEAAINRV